MGIVSGIVSHITCLIIASLIWDTNMVGNWTSAEVPELKKETPKNGKSTCNLFGDFPAKHGAGNPLLRGPMTYGILWGIGPMRFRTNQ
jgi:hypothetical protein